MLNAILEWFRRPPPIVDRASLADFLDTRAAFIAQKSIFDYVRGRSGPYFSIIIKEEAFKAGVEEARWKNYPYGVTMVAEMLHGQIVSLTGNPVGLGRFMHDLSLEVFDRYPVPAALGEEYWAEARRELAIRCNQIALHPPKLVKDIPTPHAKVIFDNMPIHEKLRELDFELITNQLRVNLISMHRDFHRYADLQRLAADVAPAVDSTAA
jgi:hypothetical protein